MHVGSLLTNMHIVAKMYAANAASASELVHELVRSAHCYVWETNCGLWGENDRPIIRVVE